MPNPTCPTNCDSNLPAWLFSNCAPVVKSSEIRRLFFAKVGAAPFTNWLNASEWLQRLDQSSTTSDDLIRAIDVIGDLPAGSQVIKEISLRRKITVTKDRTLNFTIDDVSQVNYDAARVLECNAQYKFWFETEGGRLFGGNDGEIGNIDINSILARGADSTEELQGVITWRNKFMPESGISPIFDSNAGSGPGTTFNTAITFEDGGSASAAGVTAAFDTDPDATDDVMMFEFNAISPLIGTPINMNITLGGDLKLVVNTQSDYSTASAPFKWTDSLGVVHTGVFTDGTVAF